jgi:hypothetical protein
MLDVFAVLAEKHLDAVVTDDPVRHRRSADRRRGLAGVRRRKAKEGRDA